ncbi:putative uncharacterized protein DDB_G0268364 [Uranotaenia lowii]|uniref:putative uncharacterized protein DDB_G0268364 n=1 Tax=Uranotaenia lowii TaxID=190385 RepID=UPI0024797873|nr:putative uncharacterized protein DDB_G0268364 [Uranotaenia lowii]
MQPSSVLGASVTLLIFAVIFVSLKDSVCLIQSTETQSAAIFDPECPNFKAQQTTCSKLCGFCPSCNGFYCGEECICECRQNDTEHAQCIHDIKLNSRDLGLKYDVLVQQSNNGRMTRFSRSAAPRHGVHDHLNPDELSTFRKVLEMLRIPIDMSSISLPKARMSLKHLSEDHHQHHHHHHHQQRQRQQQRQPHHLRQRNLQRQQQPQQPQQPQQQQQASIRVQ